MPGSTCTVPPVHPHARGEHPAEITVQLPVAGSSPRAWGTQSPHHFPDREARFIPTRVGNTPRPECTPARSAVHPHARGEHELTAARMAANYGSSPRAWGTRGAGGKRSHPGRFIPTRVGNTSANKARLCCRSVHPHARGEHDIVAGSGSAGGGSSPRAWGTLP